MQIGYVRLNKFADQLTLHSSVGMKVELREWAGTAEISSVPGSGRGKSKKVDSKKLPCHDVESKKRLFK